MGVTLFPLHRRGHQAKEAKGLAHDPAGDNGELEFTLP